MIQKNLKIDVVQDGQLIQKSIISKYKLSGRDISYSTNSNIYINFVGIVQKGEELLVSIPKHFMNIETFKSLEYREKIKYIRIIMGSIQKGAFQGYQNKEYSELENISSDFPLEQYFDIYNYFSKYGLYRERKKQIKINNGDKVSWKTTLNKSKKIIINKNIIFNPLFYKKQIDNETIVTDSMIFVINYTYMFLKDFIRLPDNSRISNGRIDWNILNNSIVIFDLQRIYNKTFKDIDKNLIQSIIMFLKKVNKKSHKNFNIKVYKYENIWEKVVQEYLIKYFNGISDKKNIRFDNNKEEKVNFFSPKIHYNTVHKKWFLKPDHYYRDQNDKKIYIFDSKYYQNLDDLNHKQFVYHILLLNKYPNYKIFDSLVVPYESRTSTEEYLNVDSKYLSSDIPITIYLTKLNMIDALISFIEL